MSCPVCDKLPLKRVRSIDRHLKAGKKSLMAIAEHYAVDIGDLRKHLIGCVENQGVPREDEELLSSQRQLRVLITQFQQDIADGKHQEFNPEDGIDGRSTVSYLLQAMREYRETVVARQKIRTSDEIYQDLRETVIDPLIRALVQISVEEAKRLRDELFDLTKSMPEHHPKIKLAVDASLERISDRLSAEALHDIPDKVKAAVGQKTGRRPTAH